MKHPQRILISSVLVTGIITFSLGWFFARNISISHVTPSSASGTETESTPAAPTIRDLEEVSNTLQETYYDPAKLDRTKLEFGAVKGFVEGIGDPYTVFMTPEESADFENGLAGQLEGIGAELEVKEGKLVVITPLKNSPAERAGVKPGDVILKINDEFAEEMTFYEAIRKIRGKKGTTVVLTILREKTPEPLVLTITREEIIVDTITVEKLSNDIFYITVNQFNDHTKNEMNRIVQKILLERASGIIVDVRGNGGGFLDIAVEVLSEFIKGKQSAVVIKKRDQTKNETVYTNGSGRLADIPLVVLVNKGSASASEIIAGAVQDYKRGVLVGEKTFGKGSVQEIVKLKDKSSLRLTIAKWFTPLGRSIDEVGITPDKEIPLTDEDKKSERDPQLEEAVKILTNDKNLAPHL